MALTPSQRVTLTKEIAARLSDEQWPLIDLTLREFHLPTTDSWNGQKDAYIIEHVGGASDATLMQVAAHVGYEIQGIEQPPAFEPPFWEKGQLRLFVSHLAAHACTRPLRDNARFAHRAIELLLALSEDRKQHQDRFFCGFFRHNI